MTERELLAFMQARCYAVGTEESEAQARLLQMSFILSPLKFAWRVEQTKARLKRWYGQRSDRRKVLSCPI